MQTVDNQLDFNALLNGQLDIFQAAPETAATRTICSFCGFPLAEHGRLMSFNKGTIYLACMKCDTKHYFHGCISAGDVAHASRSKYYSEDTSGVPK